MMWRRHSRRRNRMSGSSVTMNVEEQLALDETVARALHYVENLAAPSLSETTVAEAEISPDPANDVTASTGSPTLATRQDDIDPDNLSYEALQSLGESIGIESRGLSDDVISLLPSSLYESSEGENVENMEHPESRTQQVSHLSEDVEYGPGKADGNFLPDGVDNKRSSSKLLATRSPSPDERPRQEKNLLENSYLKEASRTDEKKRARLEDNSSDAEKSRKKLDDSYPVGPADTDSEEDEMYRSHKTEKRSKKSEINETAPEDEADYDSALHHRKEAKRRRKEEKRMRKEEKRRRREERHRKREERRAQKKAKYVDTVTPPPDYERNKDVADDSDDDAVLRISKTSDTEETESEQKKLEIELRNKALESLRAKKAISH